MNGALVRHTNLLFFINNIFEYTILVSPPHTLLLWTSPKHHHYQTHHLMVRSERLYQKFLSILDRWKYQGQFVCTENRSRRPLRSTMHTKWHGKNCVFLQNVPIANHSHSFLDNEWRKWWYAARNVTQQVCFCQSTRFHGLLGSSQTERDETSASWPWEPPLPSLTFSASESGKRQSNVH